MNITPTVNPAELFREETNPGFADGTRMIISLIEGRTPELGTLTAAGTQSAEPTIEVMDSGWWIRVNWDFPDLTTDLGETPGVYVEVTAHDSGDTGVTYTTDANVWYAKSDGSGRRRTSRAVRDYLDVGEPEHPKRRNRRAFANYAVGVINAASAPHASIATLCDWLSRPEALVTAEFNPESYAQDQADKAQRAVYVADLQDAIREVTGTVVEYLTEGPSSEDQVRTVLGIHRTLVGIERELERAEKTDHMDIVAMTQLAGEVVELSNKAGSL